jgi:SAM-dependent methyltransferase
MIGEICGPGLTGTAVPEDKPASIRAIELPAQRWYHPIPGDGSMLDRCTGPTLDVGAGPGRLTVALAERGVPALAIDITPGAVLLARSSGALALQRDVFGHLPATGRWATVLLADGNIGIGGDPLTLLGRAAELVRPGGAVVTETGPPGAPSRCELARLRTPGGPGPWFPWASVAADRIRELGRACGLHVTQAWSDSGRWFAVLRRGGTAACAGGQDLRP